MKLPAQNSASSKRHSFLLPVLGQLGILLCVLMLFGCSSSGDPTPEEPKEIVSASTATVEGPEDILFQDGKRLFEAGYYLVAKETFAALRDTYPLGPYREFAAIKVADCAFFLNEFEEAATSYESIARNRPGSPSAPYLLLQSARSFHSINTDLGRDKEPLEKAVELYQQLIERYPNSSAALSAKTLKRDALHQLALHEKLVAEFYRKQGALAAYQARMEEYNRNWADYEQSEETQPVELLAVSKKEFGNQPPVIYAVDRPKTKSLRLSDQDDPSVAKASMGRDGIGRSQNLPLSLREVQCSKKGRPRVTVYLQDEVKAAQIDSELIVNQDGSVAIQLPVNFGSESAQIDCFGLQDLEVAGDTLRLETPLSARVVSLSRPPRVTIFLE